MEQNSWPITLPCKAKLLRSMTTLICRLLFTSVRNKLIVLSYCVLDLLFAFLYSLFFIHGSPFKFNLLLQSLAPYNDFVFPQLVFEPCYILLEDGTHSSHSYGHNARHRQSVQTIAFVRSSCCSKYKLLEMSRLLSNADMSTIELSRTFHQVTQLLRNTT